MSEGFSEAGFPPNKGIGITESLADARSLFLTPNTTVVYVWFCVDIKDGPMVVQVPPNVLGMIDDAYFRYVTDLGNVGPDKGKGGKYLLVPPGYTGTLPNEGYFVQKPRTYNNLFIIRSFVQDGDVAAAVKNVKDQCAGLSALGRGQAARAEVRQHLGHAVQHGPRQRLSFLRRTERRRSARAGRLRRPGDRRPVRCDRHQEGQAVRTRCADEGDPHRLGRGRQRHRARDHLRLARRADEVLSGPAVVHGIRRRQLPSS